MRVGLDIGGTKTDAVVLDSAGAVAHALRMPTGWGHEAVLATATDAVLRLAGEVGIAAASFDSIGVGIPGAVDSEHGIVTHARNLGVDQLDLGGLLQRNLGASVRVENDVNAAALGGLPPVAPPVDEFDGVPESRHRPRRRAGSAGSAVAGIARCSREIGHILIDPAGPLDGDGQPGALEMMASGSGIASQCPSDRTEGTAAFSGCSTRRMQAIGMPGASDGTCSRQSPPRFASWCSRSTSTPSSSVAASPRSAPRLFDGVSEVFARWESSSAFISSLCLGDRMRALPADAQTAAKTGAAWLGATPWQR